MQAVFVSARTLPAHQHGGNHHHLRVAFRAHQVLASNQASEKGVLDWGIRQTFLIMAIIDEPPRRLWD